MNGQGKTRIYFTVDVECAEERVRGGVRRRPLGYDLRVWGRLANQRQELGLSLIMRELEQQDLRGTFFVETIGAAYFGEAGLEEICRRLLDRSHDIQLHLHPGHRQVDWYSRGVPRPSDQMADYSVDEQAALLREGARTLERCGVPSDSLRAFRAGNFGASEATWRAMAAAGLRVSSNLNLCYRARGCRIRWSREENALFDTGLGIWELPISNFREPGGAYRHVQIAAVSFPEMRHFLLEAHRLGLPEVTIVTHPFEFFFVDDPETGRGRPNVFNIERLRRLCAFLRQRESWFEVDTVGALARRIEASPGARRPEVAPLPQLSWTLRYGRMAEQVYKRLTSRMPLPL